VAKKRAQDAVYATPYLPDFEYCRVVDRIWAGRNPLTAVDMAKLAGEGVTHILDLREPSEWTPPKYGMDALTAAEERGIVRKSLPVRDTGDPTSADFDAAHAFLTEALADENAQVFVHCRAGMQRTGAILVAHIARAQNLPFDDAYRLVRAGRPKIELLLNQNTATRRWLNAQK
jgi:protein-tyrosine phosphatase